MIDLSLDPPAGGPALDELAALGRALDELEEDRVAVDGVELLRAAQAVATTADATLVCSAEPAIAHHDEMAAAAGLRLVRELVQMRRPLPTPDRTTIAVRPFRPGQDDMAWLDVNNRAFAWHPEQAEWSAVELRAKQNQPWFDPEGFLLHERDGHLAGFCWTKVHDDTDPPIGEIFVIGVDPEFQGLGLGRELVVAGMQSLAARGLGAVMLYVEADNAPAVSLYRSLGFEAGRARRWYRS